MASGEQADQQFLNDLLLTDDDLVQLLEDAFASFRQPRTAGESAAAEGSDMANPGSLGWRARREARPIR